MSSNVLAIALVLAVAGGQICVFTREQTPACTAVSLHLGVGVILTAMAPNRSSRAPGGRDDRGPRSAKNTKERTWTRPLCSSSSFSCYYWAAAGSSTDAGFESEGGGVRSPGLFAS